MDKDVLLVIVGGVIGLLSSLLTIIAQRKLDEKGELNIFYRFTHEKSKGTSWGFENESEGRINFKIPVIYEFQNTSNVTRVLRDVSLLLYNKNKFLCIMVQISSITVTTHSGKGVKKETNYSFGTENGSYSFVIDPRSISRIVCEYEYVIKKCEIQNEVFDTIKLRYFDERNKEHLFTLRNVSNCWEEKTYEADKDWILAK